MENQQWITTENNNKESKVIAKKTEAVPAQMGFLRYW